MVKYDGKKYKISDEYMARVKEVTDWALDSGMYVIINIHWDGGWWENFPKEKESCMEKYTAIWEQIAEAFEDYDERLVFESLNEEGCWDLIWNRYSRSLVGKDEAYGLLNEINQTFTDTIRGADKKNKKRHLLIAGYATDIVLTCDDYFKMPKDLKDRCAVSIHYYTPATYCVIMEDVGWGGVQTWWGSEDDYTELKQNMNLLYETFVSKGVPVIIGEFGVVMDNKDKENAILYLKSVAEEAYKKGMCPILWDTANKHSFYNRYNCSMSEYGKLKEAFESIKGEQKNEE